MGNKALSEHPGGIVRRRFLEPLGLSVTAAARGLGITRQALSDVLNARAGISVDMAIRLSKAFGVKPEAWLQMQMAYDLEQARRRAKEIHVQRFSRVGARGQQAGESTIRRASSPAHLAKRAVLEASR